jgi:hypothetical protein
MISKGYDARTTDAALRCGYHETLRISRSVRFAHHELSPLSPSLAPLAEKKNKQNNFESSRTGGVF